MSSWARDASTSTARPVVVGILNRTRDSFRDGGAYHGLDRLLARAERLVGDAGGTVLPDGGAPAGARAATGSGGELAMR